MSSASQPPAYPGIDLSIVIAVYKCRGTLAELHRRLGLVLPSMVSSYEIVFVDDDCPDNSWEEIQRLAYEDVRVRGIKLSRNFGQSIAIAAGLAETHGGRVVVMDGDLQDPPEAIHVLWQAAEKGAFLVYGKRRSDHQSATRIGAGKLYFAFLRLISGRNIDPEYGTFTLLSREVVDAYLQFSEPNRHYLFILYWLGCGGIDVEYDRDRRAVGKSSYHFWRLVRHSYQGVIFYSQSLLYILTGMVAALAAVSLAIPIFGAESPLIHSIELGLFGILASGVFLILGAFGGNILEYTKRRPLFIVLKRTRRTGPQ